MVGIEKKSESETERFGGELSASVESIEELVGIDVEVFRSGFRVVLGTDGRRGWRNLSLM